MNKTGRKYDREKWGWKDESEINHYQGKSKEQLEKSYVGAFIGIVGMLVILIVIAVFLELRGLEKIDEMLNRWIFNTIIRKQIRDLIIKAINEK